MEVYNTEEQQVEAIKRFWKEYGISIVGGAVLGLGGLFGWKAYQQHVVGQQEAASAAFQQVADNAMVGDSELATVVEGFNADHGDSGYGPLADLLLARSAALGGDYVKAESLLQGAVADLDEATKPLAQMRLVRVQIAQDKMTDALATLDTITNEAFIAQREELKGDILLKQGDVAGAKAAYEAAVEAGGAMTSPLLQVKLDELA